MSVMRSFGNFFMRPFCSRHPSQCPLALTVAMGLTLLSLSFPGHAAPRGSLISDTLVRDYSVQALSGLAGQTLALTGAPRCGVQMRELLYRTVGVHGEPATASAMLLLPQGPGCTGSQPLLGWARGTETLRDSQQASQEPGGPATALMTFYAAQGYVVAATDYLGLGKSDYRFHPYLHADSEASAIIDALRAARLAGKQDAVRLNGKVALAGYSQGGHASMAAQRAIEKDFSTEFDLRASAPMSGPYALSQTFLDNWNSPHGTGDALAPYLFVYTLNSMQNTYRNIYGSAEQVLKPPYAEQVQGRFPGKERLMDMARAGLLPPLGVGDNLRQARFAEDFVSNPRNALRVDLVRNDLLAWTPKTPTALCGSSRDTVVPWRNAQTASQVFEGRGVKVTLVDVDAQIPKDVDGIAAHTSWGAALCMAQTRRLLLDPLMFDGGNRAVEQLPARQPNPA